MKESGGVNILVVGVREKRFQVIEAKEKHPVN